MTDSSEEIEEIQVRLKLAPDQARVFRELAKSPDLGKDLLASELVGESLGEREEIQVQLRLSPGWAQAFREQAETLGLGEDLMASELVGEALRRSGHIRKSPNIVRPGPSQSRRLELGGSDRLPQFIMLFVLAAVVAAYLILNILTPGR